MKLTAVRVQNFRSIVDSELVQLDRVTVLVGKNEQGKTTFLRALHSLNPKSRYAPSDLPNHLRANLEEKWAADIPVICARLSPTGEERKALVPILSDIDQIEEFVITRFYDAHFSYRARRKDGTEVDVGFTSPDISKYVDELRRIALAFQSRLESHATRLAGFLPAISQALSHNQQFLAGEFFGPLVA